MAQRLDYAESRSWTNYLTLDPLLLVQNVLGGGDVQRDRIAIANLEVQAADLVRRREEVAGDLAQNVVDRVLQYERYERELTLLASQIETQQLRQAAMEAGYRTGQGSTASILTVWQRTEDLQTRYDEKVIGQGQTRTELEQLIGHEFSEASGACAISSSCDLNPAIEDRGIQSGERRN